MNLPAYLRGSFVEFGRDLRDDWILQQYWIIALSVGTIWTSQWTVGGYGDTAGMAEIDQIHVDKVGVDL